jgi:hypothetical protein
MLMSLILTIILSQKHRKELIDQVGKAKPETIKVSYYETWLFSV